MTGTWNYDKFFIMTKKTFFYIDQDGNRLTVVDNQTHIIDLVNKQVLVGVYEGTDGFRIDGEFDLHIENDHETDS